MTDHLDVALLHRPRAHQNEADSYSVDFLVNDISLFATTRARARDLWGCFNSQWRVGANDGLAKVFMDERKYPLPLHSDGLP
jgi:hypothetical protein